MALVTRYFSTTSAGAGDGTTWADRAALFDGSNNWSTIITGFTYTGTDSLVCMIGPGDYTCGQALTSATVGGTAPTTNGNHLVLQACDSSGNLWIPPDQGWSSAEPIWDISTMPHITGTVNGYTLDVSGIVARGIYFDTSASLSGIARNSTHYDWCYFRNPNSNTGVNCIGAAGVSLTNCVCRVEGTSYSAIIGIFGLVHNVRLEGNASATSGNRNGYSSAVTNATHMSLVTAINNPGSGIVFSHTGNLPRIINSIAAYNDGDGIVIAYTGSGLPVVGGCIVVNNGNLGINSSTGNMMVQHNRFRDNGSGNFDATELNTDFNETSAGTDADEFVDATSGDLRIKSTSSLWGLDYGVKDEDASGSSGFPLSRIVN